MTLTSKQRLTAAPQPQNPLSKFGKTGLLMTKSNQVRQALDARELIEVTLLQNTDENIRAK